MGSLQSKLEEYKDGFTKCCDQLKLVYREFVFSKSEWEDTVLRLKQVSVCVCSGVG